MAVISTIDKKQSSFFSHTDPKYGGVVCKDGGMNESSNMTAPKIRKTGNRGGYI